ERTSPPRRPAPLLETETSSKAAAFCGAMGWAASYGARAMAAHYLRKPLRALRRAVSGSALERTPRELLHQLAHPHSAARRGERSL
ncbi:MAG: hypothetical protein AAFQ96_08900, partial [Pseudomonadota bacterium]